jgi:hypothetical protein
MATTSSTQDDSLSLDNVRGKVAVDGMEHSLYVIPARHIEDMDLRGIWRSARQALVDVSNYLYGEEV